MIFTIVESEVRTSKIGTTYLRFTVIDDYEHKYFANLFPGEWILNRFYEKNGIYLGDNFPLARDFIGFIISAEKEIVKWGNHWFYNVRLI